MSISVSVCVTTFNHAQTISSCLDSILAQETSFDFDVVVHDDCSTDGTIEILKSYKKRYNDKIDLLIQDRNRVSQGERGIQMRYNFSRAKGAYLAICEGDDQWLAPDKLQTQWNILENDSSLSMCCSSSIRLNCKTNKSLEYRPGGISEDSLLRKNDILRKGGGYTDTASYFFRAKYFKEKDLPSWLSYLPMDYTMVLYMNKKGGVFCLAKPTVLYRTNQSSSWTARFDEDLQNRIKFHKQLRKMWWLYFMSCNLEERFSAILNVVETTIKIQKNKLSLIRYRWKEN